MVEGTRGARPELTWRPIRTRRIDRDAQRVCRPLDARRPPSGCSDLGCHPDVGRAVRTPPRREGDSSTETCQTTCQTNDGERGITTANERAPKGGSDPYGG